MSHAHRRFLSFLVAILLIAPTVLVARGRIVTTVEPAAVAPRTATPADFTSTEVEAYLSAEMIAWIRPGLNITVNSVTIPSDRRPVVEITITDSFGNRVDRLGQATPGPISISFILARWDEVTGEYVPYTVRTQTVPAGQPNAGASAVQGSADSGGTWTDLEMGRATYKFRTALPADFPTNKTYTVGIYATRNMTDTLGKSYYDNVEHDFRPDGAAVTERWAKMTDATCNNCHDQLAFHGGSRRDVKLCVMCHTEGGIDPDTGNSIDMEVMIHRIHAPGELENPFVIVGFQQAVHDYSHVTFPQDVRNCDNCHVGITPAQKAADSHRWFTNPTRDACGSCHDEINWTTGHGHAAGPQLNDAACSTCHQPDGPEFGASVKGAHVIPTKSSQLPGLNVQIVSVTNTAPGERPTVQFRVTNDAGEAVDATKLNTYAPILAGPTTSYDHYWRENAVGKGSFDPATGLTTYTFTNAIPADATGSYVISGDFYRNVTLTRADGEPGETVRDAAFNPIRYIAVTDAAPQARRTVVAVDKCNVCHDTLALHGGQRMATEECVICHNPNETDRSRRPANAGAPRSVSFQYMVHRIHMGHLLEGEFTVYGFGGTPHDYTHVGYPTDQRNCNKCHVNNSQQLPVPATADPVNDPRAAYTPMGASAAACLGCHDSQHAFAHAFLNTAYFPSNPDKPVDSCAACHGPTSAYSVDKVHAK